jgi:DNA polymerase-3 subunit beta
MNIIVIREKLKEGVDIVSKISSDHPTLSILKNILIEAEKDRIRITATNLEVGMQYTVPGKVVEEGTITVPATLLQQLLGALVEDRVTLSTEDQTLTVTTDNYEAKIQGVSAEEFPLIPKLEGEPGYIEMESEVLKDALQKTLAAGQFTELRPELNSIFLQFAMDRLVFAATDSFRLAEKTLNESEFTSDIDEEFRILVPLKTAQDLIRLLKNTGTVRIMKDENQILFRTQEAEFISRLLSGNFPDYQAIIPKEFKAELTISKAEFTDAVRLVGVFGSNVPEVVFKPTKDNKGVEVFSRDEKLGENRYSLAAKVKGDFNDVSFNWKYLAEGLKVVNSKDVIFAFSEDNRPAMLRSREDVSFLYFVMRFFYS